MEIQKHGILILDDENAIKENLVLFLEDEGFSVVSVDTAEKALELIHPGCGINLGIVDIRLPKMNGDKFIIEAGKLCPEIKFIIHTGSIEFELSDALVEIGLSSEDIFKKPVVDISALIKRIKEVL